MVEVPMNCVLATFTYIYSSSLTQYHATYTYIVILSLLAEKSLRRSVISQRRSSTEIAQKKKHTKEVLGSERERVQMIAGGEPLNRIFLF